ncbi:MAG: FHA domain-containing protein [Candidatus Promineifilaceae bacterium]
MNTPAYRLIVRRGKSPKPEYALSEQAAIIGREAINDIMLQELEISRRHASVTFADGRYTIEDLNSTNGTFVNGRRISTPVELRDGDVIDLGDTVSLVFQGPARVGEATLVESDPGIVDQPTAQKKEEATQAQYSPPPEVPQYAQQSPIPTPAWQTSQDSFQQLDPEEIRPMPPKGRRDRRRLYIGCGCLVLLLIIGCFASSAILDSYQNGDLLYCQSLRPIWETVFGVGRVAAICQ